MPFNHHNRKLILLINYKFKDDEEKKKKPERNGMENDLWLKPLLLSRGDVLPLRPCMVFERESEIHSAGIRPINRKKVQSIRIQMPLLPMK